MASALGDGCDRSGCCGGFVVNESYDRSEGCGSLVIAMVVIV
jgi:hypothetical protein